MTLESLVLHLYIRRKRVSTAKSMRTLGQVLNEAQQRYGSDFRTRDLSRDRSLTSAARQTRNRIAWAHSIKQQGMDRKQSGFAENYIYSALLDDPQRLNAL